MNFKEESKELMSQVDLDADVETSELRQIRVNDLDIKQAVNGLESSEDEALEDETSYKKKGK